MDINDASIPEQTRVRTIVMVSPRRSLLAGKEQVGRRDEAALNAGWKRSPDSLHTLPLKLTPLILAGACAPGLAV